MVRKRWRRPLRQFAHNHCVLPSHLLELQVEASTAHPTGYRLRRKVPLRHARLSAFSPVHDQEESIGAQYRQHLFRKPLRRIKVVGSVRTSADLLCYRYPFCQAAASMATVVTRSTGSRTSRPASRRSMAFR